MKKYKYLALFAVLVSILTVRAAVVTYAEDGDSISNTNDTTADTSIKVDGSLSPIPSDAKEKTEMKDKIDSMRKEAKTKMDALRINIKNEKDAAKEKIEELRIASREKVLTRFDEVVKNITNLEARVNAQISALDAKGVNTTSAKASIAIVDTNLTVINTKIAAANTLLAKSSSELTTGDKSTLKTLAGDIQALVKSTRQTLSDAVKSLKSSVKIKMETKAEAKGEVRQ